MNDKNQAKAAFRAKVQEMKDGIAQLLEPHALRGSGGLITIALLELGIERHLRICPTEQSARDLFDGVLRNVLEKRNTGGMSGQVAERSGVATVSNSRAPAKRSAGALIGELTTPAAVSQARSEMLSRAAARDRSSPSPGHVKVPVTGRPLSESPTRL